MSEFNGTIDWNKVKNAGVDFAIIRIGYRGYGTGRIVIDSQALNNLAGAQKAGVKIGAYFFSTAINEEEAVEEAEYVMDILDDYNVTYPIVYDCEGFDNPDYRTYGLSKTARTDNAIAFLNRVEQGGYDAMMYASKSGYENENNWETSRLETLFDMWVAHYPYYTDWGVEYPSYDAVKGTITSYAGEFRMWQFTSQGKIDGISTNVDWIWNITVRKIRKIRRVQKNVLMDHGTISTVTERWRQAGQSITAMNTIMTAKAEWFMVSIRLTA